MTCSARSFSLSNSDCTSAASACAVAPRGRVPAIGRVETVLPRIGHQPLRRGAQQRKIARNAAAPRRDWDWWRANAGKSSTGSTRRARGAPANPATNWPDTRRPPPCIRARGARRREKFRVILLDSEYDAAADSAPCTARASRNSRTRASNSSSRRSLPGLAISQARPRGAVADPGRRRANGQRNDGIGAARQPQARLDLRRQFVAQVQQPAAGERQRSRRSRRVRSALHHCSRAARNPAAPA